MSTEPITHYLPTTDGRMTAYAKPSGMGYTITVVGAPNLEMERHAKVIVAQNPREPLIDRFTKMVEAFGGGYHPDTPAEDYSSLPDGYDAATVEELTDLAFSARFDVYGITLDVTTGLGFDPYVLGEHDTTDEYVATRSQEDS